MNNSYLIRDDNELVRFYFYNIMIRILWYLYIYKTICFIMLYKGQFFMFSTVLKLTIFKSSFFWQRL